MDYPNIIVSLFGIVTGVFGVIFGLKKDRQVKLEAIKQYYDESNSEELRLFEGAPGYHVVSQYEYFKEYIEFRRKETYKGHSNTGYALYFKKPAHRIMKRYNY